MEADHVEQYLSELTHRDYTDASRAKYRQTLRRFAREVAGIPLEQVSADDVLAFSRFGGNRNTQAHREAILRGFFDWHVREGRLAVSPLARVDTIRRPNPVTLDVLTVTTEEAKQLLDYSYTEQEKLCVAMLIYTGCRLSAVSGARWGDVHFGHKTISFHEKGDNEIVKPMPDALARLLGATYLTSMPQLEDDAYIIPSDGRTRRPNRDPRIIGRILGRVAERAGIHVHAHLLRASFAVRFLEENPDSMVALQALMGHSRLDTTEVYLRRLDRRGQMERVRSLTY